MCLLNGKGYMNVCYVNRFEIILVYRKATLRIRFNDSSLNYHVFYLFLHDFNLRFFYTQYESNFTHRELLPIFLIITLSIHKKNVILIFQ